MSNSPPAGRLPAIVLEATDVESSQGNTQVDLVEEEDCDLKAPTFDRWKDHTFGSNFQFLNNGFTIELATRRGCARTEVESLKRVSVQISIYRVFRAEIHLTREAQFKAGLYEKSVDVSAEAIIFGQQVQFGNSRLSLHEKGNHWESKKSKFQSRLSSNSHILQSIPGMELNFEVAKQKESWHEAAQVGNKRSRHGDGHQASTLSTRVRMDMPGLPSHEITANKTVEYNTSGGILSGKKKIDLGEKSTAPLEPQDVMALVPATSPVPAPSFSTTNQSTEAQQDPTAEPSTEKPPGKRGAESKQLKHFLVIGILSPSTGIPDERVLIIDNPKHLFRSIWWGIVRLRGFRGLISLKHVTGFSVYKCDPFTPKHTRQRLNGSGKQIMAQLYHTYRLWSPDDKDIQQWMDWIHQELNHHYYTPEFDPDNDPHQHKMLSLELILGWSVFRLSFVVLAPVLLSLGIGFWLNSKGWTDPTSIQTAWSVASYIATAGAFLAAVLGFISNVSDK